MNIGMQMAYQISCLIVWCGIRVLLVIFPVLEEWHVEASLWAQQHAPSLTRTPCSGVPPVWAHIPLPSLQAQLDPREKLRRGLLPLLDLQTHTSWVCFVSGVEFLIVLAIPWLSPRV